MQEPHHITAVSSLVTGQYHDSRKQNKQDYNQNHSKEQGTQNINTLNFANMLHTQYYLKSNLCQSLLRKESMKTIHLNMKCLTVGSLNTKVCNIC